MIRQPPLDFREARCGRRSARRDLLTRERPEAAHHFAQVMSHLAPPGVVDPPLESDLERRNPGLGREARGGIGHAATLERGRRGGCERGELAELPFAQLGVGPDQRVTPAREVGERGVFVRAARYRCKGRGDDLERWRSRGGCQDALCDEGLKLLGAEEEDLPLVREVAEERPSREAGVLGNFGHRDLVVTGGAIELECRLLETSDSIVFPATHESYATRLHSVPSEGTTRWH